MTTPKRAQSGPPPPGWGQAKAGTPVARSWRMALRCGRRPTQSAASGLQSATRSPDHKGAPAAAVGLGRQGRH